MEKSLEMQIVENLNPTTEKKSQITTLDIIPYLSGDAQHFARREINSTIMQYVTADDQAELQAQLKDCMKWGIAPHFDFMPFMGSAPERLLCGPTPKRESVVRWRRVAMCSFFNKVVLLEKEGDAIPEQYTQAVARTVQRLYDSGLIFLGVSQIFCAPCSTMIPDEETILRVDHNAKSFVVILFWVYVKPEQEKVFEEIRADRLNAFLKNVAFTDKEGELGNSDWSGL